ncbi:multidrug ABC transporter permease [Leuconostoc falkenbergense]|uniref:multidrug ABC transporter permease n=1 Tax=Leuconostoc falkenbergense TaxID=2766470 RepID=UPI0024AD8615|nr:multidrug ABC transporter permease [Leuconostoc falkenbergense]MDI6667587.1 multidrug ABC transporter permease [Leuconostoc falkenbergense]
MIDFMTLTWFHLKLFAQNSYFRTIVFVTTIGHVLMQYVAANAVHDLGNQMIWLRAGIIGTWAAGTSAAGVIPYQRAQGTMAYVLDTSKGESVSLATLIIPAACFGLLAFPVAWLASFVLGINTTGISWMLGLGVITLWLSVILLDFVVAGLFVLTPNAMLYESLLLVPILIGAGIYTVPQRYQMVVEVLRLFLPMATPVKLILQPQLVTGFDVLQMLIFSLVWLFLAHFLLKISLQRLRVTGDMAVV